MFEAARGGRGWRTPLLGGLVAGLLVGAWVAPERVGAALERVQDAVWGRPFAPGREQFPYAESPLAVSLGLDAGMDEAERAAVLAWADALAEEMGRWLQRETEVRDLAAAEEALVAAGRADAFVVELARRLRDRQVHLRSQRSLRAVEPPPIHAHPDELAWVGAHVAWRLDLDMVLMRSPVHHYLVWRGAQRTLELSCFRRVDELGRQVPSEEPSVGRRLVAPVDHYPSGAGGIHEAQGDGVYREVRPDSLAAELLARRIHWRGFDGDDLAGALPEAEAPDVWLAWQVLRGVEAWERGDRAEVRDAALEGRRLRAAYGARLPPVRDEEVLAAAAGLPGAALQEVLSVYAGGAVPERPVNEVHRMGLWLDLRQGGLRPDDFNARLVPLMAVTRDPDRVRELCGHARSALQGTSSKAERLFAPCRELR